MDKDGILRRTEELLQTHFSQPDVGLVRVFAALQGTLSWQEQPVDWKAIK